jgi:hypothetical protein
MPQVNTKNVFRISEILACWYGSGLDSSEKEKRRKVSLQCDWGKTSR